MKEKTLEGRVRDLEEAVKRRKKWEYECLCLDLADLWRYGQEGWEVCAVTNGIVPVAIMKREIIE